MAVVVGFRVSMVDLSFPFQIHLLGFVAHIEGEMAWLPMDHLVCRFLMVVVAVSRLLVQVSSTASWKADLFVSSSRLTEASLDVSFPLRNWNRNRNHRFEITFQFFKT
ncbi:unnamed protein product [Brassica oleracea]